MPHRSHKMLPIVNIISLTIYSFHMCQKKPRKHSCGQFRTFFGLMNGILHDDADILFCVYQAFEIFEIIRSQIYCKL